MGIPKIYKHDTIRFLRKLTLRRVWNMLLLLVSYYVTKWLKRPIQWGLPMTISFEPTTACNLRCPECPSGLRQFSRDTGNLKTDFFRATVDQLYKDTIWLIFYFQGEPYINPAFLDMVNHAHTKGMYTMTSTNGHFLNKENAEKTVRSGLDRIIISVDGTTQETYEQYRIGGKLETVLQGARNLVQWKKDLKSHSPHIIFQFLVVSHNEHQMQELQKLAKEIGINEVRFKTAQVYDYENGNALLPKNLKYSRYQPAKDGTWKPKHVLHNHCWKLWHASVITWDGLVVPCCFDKDAIHRLGNLKNHSFKEIWNAAPYQDFRTSLLKGRSEIDICTNCTEGCSVWA